MKNFFKIIVCVTSLFYCMQLMAGICTGGVNCGYAISNYRNSGAGCVTVHYTVTYYQKNMKPVYKSSAFAPVCENHLVFYFLYDQNDLVLDPTIKIDHIESADKGMICQSLNGKSWTYSPTGSPELVLRQVDNKLSCSIG